MPNIFRKYKNNEIFMDKYIWKKWFIIMGILTKKKKKCNNNK